MNKTICCVNDMPGVGKIALGAMIPILSAKGISVTNLPTALVSNTLDYGKFQILDTTDYMRKTVEVWNELGFKFDCISTGFMVNPAQINVIERLISCQDSEKLMVIVDPIMGDDGHLYNGMNEMNVEIMKRLSSLADILIPNFTEACFLTNLFKELSHLTYQQSVELIQGCRALGAKSVVITSIKVEEKDCVIGYDHKLDETFMLEFEYIQGRFPGTGDIFSAVLAAEVLNQKTLKEASFSAMETVKNLVIENLESKEKYLGVNIEKFIQERKL